MTPARDPKQVIIEIIEIFRCFGFFLKSSREVGDSLKMLPRCVGVFSAIQQSILRNFKFDFVEHFHQNSWEACLGGFLLSVLKGMY